jgi:hypothetical protein|tara:strand:+ start:611 stop:790 length:180 start_codon:yes stop_codon:yes gene_type:complete
MGDPFYYFVRSISAGLWLGVPQSGPFRPERSITEKIRGKQETGNENRNTAAETGKYRGD